MCRGYSSDRYSVCGKRPLALAAMNAELPPFKNEEHNSESASTIDHVITPLIAAGVYYHHIIITHARHARARTHTVPQRPVEKKIVQSYVAQSGRIRLSISWRFTIRVFCCISGLTEVNIGKTNKR